VQLTEPGKIRGTGARFRFLKRRDFFSSNGGARVAGKWRRERSGVPVFGLWPKRGSQTVERLRGAGLAMQMGDT
jgi:hypothetical protein